MLLVAIQKDTQFKSFPSVLQNIFQNLCENAIFFSQFNKKSRPKVDVNVSQYEKGGLHLSVIDNGCGIHPDVQDKIWDMFFVGNELSKGNGLSLYITKKAVESLNGTIHLKTKVDEYTEFSILFPELQIPQLPLKNQSL